jgi:thymidylate synthase (FAD)
MKMIVSLVKSEEIMKVKLISHSTVDSNILPVSANGYKDKDIENLVAYCARVSNPGNQYNIETNERLLKYLMKHKHWSPFEMVSVCMEIETTRDIARQILRHRSFSFQEFSQRYANPAEMGEMFELREARLQDEKNRQNSFETDDADLAAEWIRQQQKVINQASQAYKWAISNGIAKEQARAVLPEGNTKSRMYMNGTLRSWIHYIELRRENGTQKEHMDIAKACAKVISEIFPIMEAK